MNDKDTITIVAEPPPEAALLEQVMRVETTLVACKRCGSTNVVKDGVDGGVQNYWCKACRHRYAGNNALPGMRTPPEYIATAVSLFYDGLSLEEIRQQIAQTYPVSPPSTSTVYEWVVRFTQEAVAKAQGYKAHTGTFWAADETVLNVAGGQTKSSDPNTAWFWDVIDEDTRFLLASRISRSRTIKEAEALFADARRRATRLPKHIITDKLAAYVDGIERVFGGDAKHIQSAGLASEHHNNLIERFHGTLKQRTKVMRGLKNKDTAQLVMDGWLVHYNFFRPHESLKGKTPGEAARVAFPFHSWKDVVLDGYHPQEVRV